MKIDHEYISNNNVIDDYLLNSLSEEVESAFEEHLLNCEVCRKDVLQTEKVIAGFEYFNKEAKDLKMLKPREKSYRSIRIFIQAAAVILFAAIISILYFHNRNSSRISVNNAKDSVKSNQAEIKFVSDSTEERNIQKTDNNSPLSQPEGKAVLQKKYALNDLSFEPLPVLENAIGNQLRGTEIIVRKPAVSEKFTDGDSVTFDWSINDSSIVWLVIKNNRGETMLKETVSPPVIKQLNKPGLFYWHLMVNNDIIYTGKIVVNE